MVGVAHGLMMCPAVADEAQGAAAIGKCELGAGAFLRG